MSHKHACANDGPPCPTCGSRQTSRCGETDDGVIYLCSPCCEAFPYEPPQVTPSLVALRIAIVGTLAALALILWHAYSTREPQSRYTPTADIPVNRKPMQPW